MIMSFSILDGEVVQIEFECEGRPNLTLEGELFDTSLTRRWLDLLRRDLGDPETQIWNGGVFTGDVFFNRELILKRLKSLISEINRFDGGTLFKKFQDKELGLSDLEELHDLKVGLTHLMETVGFQFPQGYAELLQKLNHDIHQVEFSRVGGPGTGSVTVVPYPPSRLKMTLDELKLFTLNNRLGWIYLDYGTNGVPFADAFRNQDDTMPTAQSELTSGFWLSFFQDAESEEIPALKNWLRTRFNRDISDPTLALGQAPLGRLKKESLEEARKVLPYLKRVVQVRTPGVHMVTREQKTADTLAEVRDALNAVSPSFCAVKWKHATINFATASSKSCCHLEFRKIERPALAGEGGLHDTAADRQERKQMLEGKRPANCSSCWWVEDEGNFSNRHIWSSKPWIKPTLKEVAQVKTVDALNPSWLELNFSSTCQLKCSYCSPIFSSKWTQEVEQHGFYPTVPAHNDIKYLQGMPSVDDPENSDVMKAFWPWFDKAYPDLRLLKITGGEPLLSPSTFKLLEYIADRPHKLLTLSINSNLSIPPENFNRFLDLANKMKNEAFYLHPSLDTWGERAEYIRFGLNMNAFRRNVEAYLERTKGSLYVICTLNNLCFAGLKDFWQYILSIKQKYGGPTREICITTEILHGPIWQNIAILPGTFEHYLEETLAFVRENMALGGVGFEEHELMGLERGLSMMRSPLEDDKRREAQKNFYRFFSEHDRRRGTNLVRTFPEMRQFYQHCKGLVEGTAVVGDVDLNA